MTTTQQNLIDLAEVLRSLAEARLWAPDPVHPVYLPDPRHTDAETFAAALEFIVGDPIELVDVVAVRDQLSDAASPVDAQVATALLIDAGADGSPGRDYATLTVGAPVPGRVWILAHVLSSQGVAGAASDTDYRDAVARAVRADWYGEDDNGARQTFVQDVTRDTLAVLEQRLEDHPDEIDDLYGTAARLVRAAESEIDAGCDLAEFDPGIERGSGRSIDIEGAEFVIGHNGEVEYRDWDEVVRRVAEHEAGLLFDKWTAQHAEAKRARS